MDFIYDKEERYEMLKQKDNTSDGDAERLALFYILANNDDLYVKAEYIYNFKEHSIRLDCLDSEGVDFTNRSKALIRLGFNLYNGYKDDYSDVMSIMSVLDADNFEIAMKAIRYKKYN